MTLDIFIKSFNRAYYLDRAIYSLKKHLKGSYKITVLDDGTPSKYLDKIKEKYPDVEIKINSSARLKHNAIEENIKHGTEINGFIIPVDLWKSAVKSASDYFIMTEDDVWLTDDIDIDSTLETLQNHKSSLLKIGWISNRKVNSNFYSISNNISAVEPLFSVGPRWFMSYLFNNKFKLYSILYRLHLINKETFKDFWIMNALLIGLYHKNYWLYLWNNIDEKVDEQMQILNATQWFRKHKNNKYNYTKFNNLKMNTTFISSATNSYHQYKIKCDINYFNHIMNNAWYKGEFNSLENFPKDIPEDYYISFLNKYPSERCTSENWKKWAKRFKEQYKKQEVEVD